MSIKAIAFDVFGTVVDWRGTISSEGRRLFGNLDVDWPAFAVEWSKAYGRAVAGMTRWTNLDVMLASAFYELAAGRGVDVRSHAEACREMSTTWSRLRPWPDVVRGFAKLDAYTLAAFTNANHAMLESLRDSSGLLWGVLLSAETVKRYKPDPALYAMVLDELGLQPDQVMVAAAHCFDLNAAKEAGMRTALISRPDEPGSDPRGLDHEADVVASDIDELARLIKD